MLVSPSAIFVTLGECYSIPHAALCLNVFLFALYRPAGWLVVYFQGSKLQLAFGFDTNIDPIETTPGDVVAASTIVHGMTSDEASFAASIMSPASPATRELNSKIASCKNCWETLASLETRSVCCLG